MESFNGKLRDECLNEHVFASLAEARRIIEAWRIDYNTVRPHSSLDYLTPEEFAAGHIPTQEAAELISILNDAFQDLPVRLFPGVSYRHIAVVAPHAVPVRDLLATTCTPPHDIVDKPYGDYLPTGPAAPFLVDLMRRSQTLFHGHPRCLARRFAVRANHVQRALGHHRPVLVQQQRLRLAPGRVPDVRAVNTQLE